MKSHLLFALAPLALLPACAPSAPKFCPVKAGDLVITEVFVNPDGDNAGRQWFELYNATSSEIDLSKVQITYSKPDGVSGKKTHVMAATKIKPRQYMVLGNVGPVARPAHVDYGYGNDLGTMLTTDGMLTITRDECPIDRATFPGFAKSSAFLPGPQAPDAIGNDTADKWCKSQVAFVDGFGTPQMANETCGPVGDGGVNPTTCKDNGSVRPIVPPMPGDLVISEIMANPAIPMGVSAESKLEWFEVEVKAKAPVDLIGLRVGNSMDPAKLSAVADLAAGNCWQVMPGDHVLFVDNKDKMMNDGLPDTGPVFIATYSLANTGGIAAIGSSMAILDALTYPDQAKAPYGDGLSYARDPDSADIFCPGKQAYGPSLLNKGSPGAKNPSCGIAPPGKCFDNGMLRDIMGPSAAGDLIVNEVMAKPAVGGNPGGEWLELKATKALDLNGLQIGLDMAKLETIGGGDCHHVAAGDKVLFAHMAGMNNGLPLVEAWQTFKFGLVDSGATIYLIMPAPAGSDGGAGLVVEQAAYKTNSNAGDAYSRDPDLVKNAFCFVKDGTPGADNPVCP